MNCRDAQEQFDAARPGSGDLGLSELASASKHLDDCPRCRSVLQFREHLDRRISRAMTDVPVPTGLKDRILQSLQETASPEDSDRQTAVPASQPVQQPPAKRSLSRRWWITTVVGTAAAAMVLGIVFWPERPQPDPRLTLKDLRRRTTLNLSELKPFDGNFEAKLPGGLWARREIRFDSEPKGDLEDVDGFHRVALYGVQVRGAHGRVVRGVLLVMPKSHLEDPPTESMPLFEDRPENYAQRAAGTYHSFAWSTEEMVYVCFIPKDGTSMDTFARTLSGPNA